MKKTHILILGLLVVVATVVVVQVVRYLPRVVPYWQCSEVYKRYSRVEGVRATYVKDYRINDTLTIGVTLLEATTDSGWAMLQENFGVPVVPKEYEELICGDSNRVTLKIIPKKEPLCLEGDTLANDVFAVSYYKHTIVHLEVKNRMQSDLFIRKQVDDIEKNDIQQYSNHEKDN
ncbi:MAG: hypothetical protein IKH33_04460 [Bacteroidales bacterium]|nr:hypothetical protein [Bacteroidales bacterium]